MTMCLNMRMTLCLRWAWIAVKMYERPPRGISWEAGGDLVTICLASRLSRVCIPSPDSSDSPLETEADQERLVCPPGGFPGGSYLLAASCPDPTLPPPPGKPSASSGWPSTKRRVHVSRYAGTRGILGDGKLLRFCQECRWRACANPRSILLAVFSRPLSRCFPLVYCPLVLCLWWTDETSSTRWTLCLPTLNLQTRLGEETRKGRGAGGDHVHLSALLLPERHRASVREKGPVPLRFLLSMRLLPMKKKATDRFRRDTIRGCHGAKRFLLFHHTLQHRRPLGSGKTVCRLLWSWSPMLDHSRRASLSWFLRSLAGAAPCETISQKGKGRGNKLMTEDWEPTRTAAIQLFAHSGHGHCTRGRHSDREDNEGASSLLKAPLFEN
jgi:hypothetical protein